MVSFLGVPSPSSMFSAYASMSASLMLFQTMLNQLLPHQVQNYIFSRITHFFRPTSSTITLVIEERDGISCNEVYNAAEIYLSSKINPDIEHFKVSKRPKDNNMRVIFAKCGTTSDSFEGFELVWRFVSEECKKSSTSRFDEYSDNNIFVSEKRYFELSFDKKHKDTVLNSYMPFVLREANVIRGKKKVVKLHTLACCSSYSSSMFWDSVNFEHPSTFETLAIDTELKKAIVEDLDRFLKRKEFYRRVGKAWKRGYLLYGPPGTGKSSLIAAMANYLKFDIYDLELSNVKRDSDLRRLLLRTTNRSILVIEDIDCSMELPDRRRTTSPTILGDAHPRDQQITLAGLLNFIDGLWSSCGDERVIIFTTNNKAKLDPSLLRPGRMDMHIHMSYLTIDGFKVLAQNYLELHDHDQHWLFPEVQELIENVQATPAEVAEELMKSEDADVSLGRLVNFLKRKRIENEEIIKDSTRSDELKCRKAKKMKCFENTMSSGEVI